ncbi:MAG: CDP-diacylglycerol--glycerol-3-phosphate 3-phosphatidyltransferase [Synechococcaceae cyanobacterium SM2_3_1]|nr:CDP-diacylglycerol--glycerol-3-phosphate 3-phosphatidyltransferase [Synechococcaceae cyanobacterium SM2_3_1]
MTLASWITLLRLLGIPFILVGLSLGTLQGRWLAVAGFAVAALTDWVDGYIARRFNQITDLGKVLDPLVDKLLVMAAVLGLVANGQIPAWGAFLLLGRELVISGWRVNQPRISGANFWGKAKTVMQIVAILLLLGSWPGGLICFWLAVVLTLISGLIYLLPPQRPEDQEI